jgi:hypothetical protein
MHIIGKTIISRRIALSRVASSQVNLAAQLHWALRIPELEP